MKKVLFAFSVIILFCTSTAISQEIKMPLSNINHPIIEGEYYLRLITDSKNGMSYSKIAHNFPGISHIKIKLQFVLKSGQKLDHLIDVKGSNKIEIPINLSSYENCKSLIIDDLDISFSVFGNQYLMTYSNEQPYLKLLKNGIFFDYAIKSRLTANQLFVDYPDSIFAIVEIDSSKVIASKMNVEVE